MKTFFLIALLAFIALPAHAATVSADDLQAGDLIRGESFNAVYYYGVDGFRYVFPNSNTYFTWYENFDDVRWLSNSDLASIQIGGNVTYKPGVKMLKINSDPKVYTVSAGGTLRAIASEAIAVELYGSNWNTKIDDVPDGFFSNYTLSERIEFASQYSADEQMLDAIDINDDKNLRAPTVISVGETSFMEGTAYIDVGTAVRWENDDDEKHAVTEWDKNWGSGTLQPGEHFTRYFNIKGEWHYYDKYQGKEIMEGALIVK